MPLLPLETSLRGSLKVVFCGRSWRWPRARRKRLRALAHYVASVVDLKHQVTIWFRPTMAVPIPDQPAPKGELTQAWFAWHQKIICCATLAPRLRSRRKTSVAIPQIEWERTQVAHGLAHEFSHYEQSRDGYDPKRRFVEVGRRKRACSILRAAARKNGIRLHSSAAEAPLWKSRICT